MANRTWIPWFPLIVLGFFVLAESLKKGVLDTIFLNLSWFFFLLWIFPYILFTCISSFKFCAWFKHNAYAVAHKLLNQCKQNNILWYSCLNATIQGGQQSEVVHSGKVRWGEKGCFKVRKSGSVREFLKKWGRFVWKGQRKINGKYFDCLFPIIAIFTYCNIQV